MAIVNNMPNLIPFLKVFTMKTIYYSILVFSLGFLLIVDSILCYADLRYYLDLPDSIVQCNVDSILLEGPQGFTAYMWNTGDTTINLWAKSDGQYNLKVKDNMNNIIEDSVYVNMLNFQLLVSDSVLNPGESAMLAVQINSQPLMPIYVDSLVAYYPLDGSVQDFSWFGNHGISYGAVPTYDRFGQPASAYSFNGTTHWVRVENSSSLNIHGDSSISICAWVKTTKSENQGIVCKWGSSGMEDDQYFLAIQDNHYWFGLSDESTTVSSVSDVMIDAWVFICGVYNSKENLSKIFINGVMENAMLLDFSIFNTPQYIAIGGWDNPSFSGALDDIRIYRGALSQDNILQLYNQVDSRENEYSILWTTGETSEVITAYPTSDSIFGVMVSDGINSCYKEVQIKVNPVSLEENEIEYHKMIISPNPVNHTATIDLRTYNFIPQEITIRNYQGLLVRKYQTSSQQIDLDLSWLKPGIYILIASDRSNSKKLKFIKQ